jgi:hypothetical protein
MRKSIRAYDRCSLLQGEKILQRLHEHDRRRGQQGGPDARRPGAAAGSIAGASAEVDPGAEPEINHRGGEP